MEIYRCTESIDFIISNNASNMDILVFKIERQLTAVNIDWSADYYKIKCFSHIIYLVAEAFLLGDENMPDTKDREIWRCFNYFGKVYNIVV